MNIKKNYFHKVQLGYDLSNINGYNFTPREIDILSCVSFTNSEKQIASILHISHRTVSTHMRNIMIKLQLHSRNLIMDFLKKSNKISLISAYFQELKIYATFVDILSSIAQLIPNQEKYRVVCMIDCKDTRAFIIQHLNLTNIILAFTDKPDVNKKTIILADTESPNIKSTLNHNIISFDREHSYLSLIAIIHELKPDININQFADQLREYIDAYSEETIIHHTDNTAQKNYNNIWNKTKYLATLLICSLLSFYIVQYGYHRLYQQHTHNDDIQTIQQQLQYISNNTSVSNITIKEQQNNLLHFRNGITLMNKIYDNRKLLLFFEKNASVESFAQLLHSINFLSCFLLYNKHDAVNAKKYLLRAKAICEKYISNHMKYNLNFDVFTPEEIYQELKIYKHLSELYAQNLYMLGRTGFYLNDIVASRRYFFVSKYLSAKLNLYEFVLNDISGLGIIMLDSLKHKINKNVDFMTIKDSASEIIDLYSKVQNLNNYLIISYNPNTSNQKRENPCKSDYTQIECSFRIASVYLELMKYYTKKVDGKQYYNGYESAVNSILTFLDKVNDKKKSLMLNFICSSFIDCEERNIYYTPLLHKVMLKLNIEQVNDSSNLHDIKSILLVSKNLSRVNSYSKADSYYQLIRLNKKLIIQNKNNKQDVKLLEKENKNFEQYMARTNKLINK